MKYRFIGDVHGKFDRYEKILKDSPYPTIQVGDLGVGFIRDNGSFHRNPSYDIMMSGNHRAIRGNHDNPGVFESQKYAIPDGSIEYLDRNKEVNMMFCGGGLSIDRKYRTPGYDYWYDEELSAEQFFDVVASYVKHKPNVMITHECPDIAASEVMKAFNKTKLDDYSITRQAFGVMFSHHQPDLWIFGHWHHDLEFKIGNTNFICLNELSYKDIDIESYLH